MILVKISFNVIQPLKNTSYQFKGNNKAANTPRIDTFEIKGNVWQLVYNNDGSLQKSLKNGEIYKEYSYPEYEIKYHNFKDGSALEEPEYYGFEIPPVTCVDNGKNKRSFTIYKHKGESYSERPIVDIKTNNKKCTHFERYSIPDGIKIKQFEDIIDADKYFMEEYGIDTYFDNLAQAHIVKSAVDDFIKLTNDKKMFKGLTIYTKNLNEDSDDDNENETVEDTGQNTEIEDCDDDKDYTYALYFYIPDEQSQIKDKIKNPEIILNTEFSWSNATIRREQEKAKWYSVGTLKGLIVHELAHYLHSLRNPKLFFEDTFPDLEKEKEIMKEVSEYAAEEPTEFVAEYVAGRMAGKKYSAEVDRLYKKYKGPELF